jgi:hypothetical protein
MPNLVDDAAEERCGHHGLDFCIRHVFTAFQKANNLKSRFNRNMGDWTEKSEEDLDWESSHFENR